MTHQADDEKILLAKGLLRIAYLAMPDSYFKTDSRCELARKVLADHGITFDPAEDRENTATPPSAPGRS